MIITEIKIKQVLNNLQLFKHDKISLAEASTIMTCHLETVRKHASKGYIKVITIGNSNFTSKLWLRDYINSEHFFTEMMLRGTNNSSWNR